MQFRIKRGVTDSLKKVITFERADVDVENGRRKSIKRSLHEHGREKLKDIYIAH